MAGKTAIMILVKLSEAFVDFSEISLRRNLAGDYSIPMQMH